MEQVPMGQGDQAMVEQAYGLFSPVLSADAYASGRIFAQREDLGRAPVGAP